MSGFDSLSAFQTNVLAQAKITRVEDLLLPQTADIARKCKVSPAEATAMVKTVSKAYCPVLVPLSETDDIGCFTTGCDTLDELIGGGIRPGMVWEVVGESAAGKTQFALRTTLTVQLTKSLKGLEGSACYISTKSDVQTGRLVDMLASHDTLSPDMCSLDDIHHIKAPTLERLIYVLKLGIPQLVPTLPTHKPLRLIVLDALAELFHEHGQMNTTTLFERSRSMTTLSSLFHQLATTHGLAMLVINEVRDAVDSGYGETEVTTYRHQSRLFGRGDSLPNENRKEALLGLVWANQPNVRIMLSRTGRRRHGVHRSENETETDEPVLIRRCTVLFSSVSRPGSVDYIVDKTGLRSIGDVIRSSSNTPSTLSLPPTTTRTFQGPDRLDMGVMEEAVSIQELAEEEEDYDRLFEPDEQFLGSVSLDGLLGPES